MLLAILLYIIVSELGGFLFLAATRKNLSDLAQVVVWGFFVSPIIAVALMGMPGLIVWAAHRALGYALYFKFYRH